MSLKNTLLLASLGATMVSCNHVQYQSLPSEPPSQESKNLELSRSGRKEQCFRENYQCLCNNVDDAFFVLGDAQMIRETLLYLASTPLGRHIISGLSDGNMKIKSKYFMPSSIGGYYAHKDNSVNLPVRDISSGNEIWLTYTLGHELVHAYQRSKGIEVNNKGLSVKQAALVEQLKEAHARACHLVMRETFSQLDVSGSEINGSLEYFMEQNLDRRLRRRMFADNQEHPNYRAKKEDYPFYLLQEALKKCNGNREKAEKIIHASTITAPSKHTPT